MLVHGDNLEVMRGMESESIDLIYADPPFCTGRDFVEFNDKWNHAPKDESKAFRYFFAAVKEMHGAEMHNYLQFMLPRLVEIHRVLKSTGSFYLHVDPTASHYLKVLLDGIFGAGNFRNEIVWHYGKMSNTSDNFPRNHDIILRYSKSSNATFFPIKGGDSEYRNRFKRFLTGNKVLYGSVKHKTDKLITGRARKVSKELGRSLNDSDILYDFDVEFKKQSDVMYVPIIKGNANESTGYPTQKPLALLERIIKASTNEGDIVLDPFCGCATACVAAANLQRKWIGIDINKKAIEIGNKRLQE